MNNRAALLVAVQAAWLSHRMTKNAAPLARAGRADVNQATPGSPTGKAAAASLMTPAFGGGSRHE